MKTQYTKEQKQEYFKQLRARWAECKTLSEQDTDAKLKYEQVIKQAGGKFSYTGFYFTLQDMKRAGLDGLPYIDTKTFDGWTGAGFKVKKGQHSLIKGLTWLEVKDKAGEDEGFLIPKEYHLFHRSQVEAI